MSVSEMDRQKYTCKGQREENRTKEKGSKLP